MTILQNDNDSSVSNEKIVNPNAHFRNLNSIVDKILSRRDIFKIGSVAAVGATVAGCRSDFLAKNSEYPSHQQHLEFDFKEIKSGIDKNIHIPSGYQADILISWGDALSPHQADFDTYNQTVDGQLNRFGYNNDFIGYAPLPMGSDNPNHALLCVNHEYSIEPMMFAKPEASSGRYSKQQAEISQAACGASIIEVKRCLKSKKWSVIKDSPFNRRISMLKTKMDITGPAKGHARMRTKADISGQEVIGTFQNCSGGITPWGTYLTCEENINHGFGNLDKADTQNPEIKKSKRFGLGGACSNWYEYDTRFDLSLEPNEINRFGWVVEIDPYNPQSKPRKHTALGRIKHEGCLVTIDAITSKAIAYMGDDQYFEYLYKFISRDKFIKNNRKHNMSLLENGTLYVARFNEDMSVNWLELTFGKNGLTPENGFHSQADVVIDTRYAADIVNATPLDRPEGIALDPINGDIYISLTMNEERTQTNIANPRKHNEHGQIICIKTNDNHAALVDNWDILLLGGSEENGGTGHKAGTSHDGIICCPDNLSFDHSGRLWVCTDQGKEWKKKSGRSDGLYGVVHQGEQRGQSKLFFRAPIGAEVTGLCFAPDDQTLFVCVQHPGSDGGEDYAGFERKSTFLDPVTRWPNPENSKLPPMPSIVQITRKGKIL